jgi:outer membrane murein-binding lipoprotein Lpp
MTATNAKRYAGRVRTQRTVNAKLNELSKAIENLASAVDQIDRRLQNVESMVGAMIEEG